MGTESQSRADVAEASGGAATDGRLRWWRTTSDVLFTGLAHDRGFLAAIGGRDYVECRIGLRRFAVLGDPELVDHIFHAGRLKYEKSLEFEPIRRAAGLNLLTDEGDSWASHRTALTPMFAKRNLNTIVDLMIQPIEDMTNALEQHDGRLVFDIHEHMVQMTLRVVSNALFSQDFGEIIDTMHTLATRGLEAAEILLRLTLVGALPKPAWAALEAVAFAPVPAPPPFKVLQDVGKGLDRAVNEILDARFDQPTEQRDLLNMLISADGGGWPRQRIRDEALTFMLAGHETTANALSWFWYLMALHPEHRARMLEEVDTVLQGRAPDADTLSQLPWTTACVQESQRYYSAVPVVSRTAVQDDVIGGRTIRKGTTVIVPIHTIHHDPRLWDNPEEFDPNRFMPGSPRVHRSAFLPFGGGRRVCIGQSFALMEMVAIAAVMSQRFTFDLEPGHPVEIAQSLTLRPRHGLRVVARRRDPLTPAAHAQRASEGPATCPVGHHTTTGGTT